jgi:hypothetical protein
MRQSRRDDVGSAHARARRGSPNGGDAEAARRGARACPPLPLQLHPAGAAPLLELALPLLDEAAGGHVEGTIGDTDPFAAVEQEVQRAGFDEIIISTLPARVSHWLRRDLPHRVEALGLPVTVVTAKQSERALPDAR